MTFRFALLCLLSILVLATPAAAGDERFPAAVDAPRPAAAPDTAAPDAAAPYDGSAPCESCPAPRPHYDSQEVIKTTRDVDQSRVINTTTVVPVAPRERTVNHLVVHENETRNVGVILHKNTIIEKEIRYRRRPTYVARRYAVARPYAGIPDLSEYGLDNAQYVGVYAPRRAGCSCGGW